MRTPLFTDVPLRLRRQFDIRSRSYRDVYEAPNTGNLWHHEKRQRTKWTIEFCANPRQVTPNARVLDVGCGDGRLACRLAALPHISSLLGIDLSPEMISLAKQRCQREQSRVRFAVQEATAVSGSWDVITCLGVVGYQRQPLEFCQYLAQLLAPSGCLILTVGNANSVWRWARAAGGAVKRFAGLSNDVPFRATPLRSLIRQLRGLGCQLETQRSLSFGLGIRESHRAVRRSQLQEAHYADRARPSRWLAQTHWCVWRKTPHLAQSTGSHALESRHS